MTFPETYPRAFPGSWLCAIAVLIGISASSPAQAQVRDEYQVKAAFLYNFARYVEWPDVSSSNAPLVTCVLGRDPFGHWLKDTIEGRAIDARTVVLRHISDPAEASSCQILFIGSSEPRRTWTAVAALKLPGLLTVGECSRTGDDDAIINFILKEGRIRFVVDPDAAARTKLRISSRLLSLSQQ